MTTDTTEATDTTNQNTPSLNLIKVVRKANGEIDQAATQANVKKEKKNLNTIRKIQSPKDARYQSFLTNIRKALIGKYYLNVWRTYTDPTKVNKDSTYAYRKKIFEWGFDKLHRFIAKNARFLFMYDTGRRSKRILNEHITASSDFLQNHLINANVIAEKHLEPFFEGQETYSETLQGNREKSLSENIRLQGEALKNIAKKAIENNVWTNEDSRALGQINDNLFNQYRESHAHYTKILASTNQALDLLLNPDEPIDKESIAKKKLLNNSKTLLEQQLKTIEDSCEAVYTAQSELFKIGESLRDKNANDKIKHNAEKMQKIANDLEFRIREHKAFATDKINKAKAYTKIVSRLQDKSGRIVTVEGANYLFVKMQDYAMHLGFLSETRIKYCDSLQPAAVSGKLAYENPEAQLAKLRNQIENDGIDPDTKKVKADGGQSSNTAATSVQLLVDLYSSGLPEHALMELLIFKYKYGLELENPVPGDMADRFSRAMSKRFNVDEKILREDPHIKLFMDAIQDMTNKPDDGFTADSQRRAQKKIVEMFEFSKQQSDAGDHGKTLAAMAAEKVTSIPAKTERARLFSYLTGALFLPVASEHGKEGNTQNLEHYTGRKELNDSNDVEKTSKLFVHWNWWFTKPEIDEKGEPIQHTTLVGKIRSFYKRSPAWCKAAIRLSQIGAIVFGASTLLTTGGLPAMAVLIWGGIGALNYTQKFVRHKWSSGAVGKALVLTAGIAAVAYAWPLLLPTLASAIGSVIASAASAAFAQIAAAPLISTLIAVSTIGVYTAAVGKSPLEKPYSTYKEYLEAEEPERLAEIEEMMTRINDDGTLREDCQMKELDRTPLNITLKPDSIVSSDLNETQNASSLKLDFRSYMGDQIDRRPNETEDEHRQRIAEKYRSFKAGDDVINSILFNENSHSEGETDDETDDETETETLHQDSNNNPAAAAGATGP